MKEFPAHIKFRYPWRKYQQRILDELSDHMDDDHLHFVAPPGSGKTVLGLEIILRLNNPVLILAPTLAIKNQWIDRFCTLFLQSDTIPDWISGDIYNPQFMTVSTYQGLHAACNGIKGEETEEESEEEQEGTEVKSDNKNRNQIISLFKKQKIKTIVVDEAHHLKKEWWKTLIIIKEELMPVVVGLTATPPYDSTGNEWKNYLEFNGPIDAEISVPELVKEGDLCPHQDYIYYTLPAPAEYEAIHKFRYTTEQLFKEIVMDDIFIRNLQTHPLWINPEEATEWIYSNTLQYISVLSFFQFTGMDIPKIHYQIIGDKEYKIPEFDYSRLTTLLNFYLFKDSGFFEGFSEHKHNLEGKLRRQGIIDKKQISFSGNSKITQSLTSSINKLQGIEDIVRFEYSQLKEELRLVILTDYIRKEYYVNSDTNVIELTKIGVMPIFEQLRRNFSTDLEIGVLTGSLIIIPRSAYQELLEKEKQYNITITNSPVPFDTNYILLTQTEKNKGTLVKIITQLFEEGNIEVLVGTKSLLGEGWDAPAINSLVLASFVRSFVLSNQMRGRAIRTYLENKNKTGNIWHLVCVDPTSSTGGDDLDILSRRFKSFVGISYDGDSAIENGITRLHIPGNISQKNCINTTNQKTFALAANRKELITQWNNGLKKGVRLIEEIKIPLEQEKEYIKNQRLYFRKTLTYFILQSGAGIITFGNIIFQSFMGSRNYIKNFADISNWISALGVFFILLFGRKLYKTAKMYLKYRDISKDSGDIGKVLLHSLINQRAIHTPYSQFEIISSVDIRGTLVCYLKGGSTFEQILFNKCMKEILDVVENPRYILIRKSYLFFFIKQEDYHAVPEIIGRNNKTATYFETQWRQHVGRCKLIYTGTKEGRKILLKSQTQSLSARIGIRTESVNVWK